MYFNRKQIVTADMKISDVILNNPYLILLLEHFGIGMHLKEKSIRDLCLENKINKELFLTFANLYNGIQFDSDNALSFSDIRTIIEYLKNSHRYYSEEMYPKILAIIKEMHIANNLQEMSLVEKFFREYFDEVTEHLDYENNIVFPYIIGIYETVINSKKPSDEIKYSVNEYKESHNDIEEKLNDLKNLLVKYLPQKNDQPIRRRLLFSLLELEYDLNIHSQIEDYILIPLVTTLELHLKKLQ
jgi:regulator of cell morphogenesis and NO signaling